jgi:cell division protein FtsB
MTKIAHMNIKRKPLFWGIIAVCTILLFLLFFSGDQNVFALYRNHLQMNEKSSEISALHHKIDSLNIEIRKLTNDTSYIERIAREKLGMAKKSEKIYKFVEEKN